MGRFLWQWGLIKHILAKKNETFIFLGDPHFLTTWVGVLLCRLLGKESYFWAHAIIRKKSLQDKVKKIFFKLPTGVLLYGSKAKENLIKLGFDEKKLHVIYNSLDYRKQLEVRSGIQDSDLMKMREKLFKNDLPIIFFIGRLTPQKQLHILINLTKELHESGTPCNLLLIGEGSEKSSLEELAKTEQLSEFTNFYGSCHTEEEVGPLIACSNLCISPGEIGLTAMHSLVYGTPIVTHDSYIHQMPEYEAIKPGLNGDLYTYGDQDSLLEKTKKWLVPDMSRKEIRNNCYKVIETFYNPEYQVEVLRKLLCSKK
jgi:glycosyltransferase involved in cell wall biosynthesis